jgi:alpha-N-arabinofuranosidase
MDLDSPTLVTARYGAVPVVDAAAVHSDDLGRLTLFCVNRSRSQPCELTLELADFGALDVEEHLTITGPDPYVTNTRETPKTVVPQKLEGSHVEGRTLRSTLPPASWSAIRLASPADC